MRRFLDDPTTPSEQEHEDAALLAHGYDLDDQAEPDALDLDPPGD